MMQMPGSFKNRSPCLLFNCSLRNNFFLKQLFESRNRLTTTQIGIPKSPVAMKDYTGKINSSDCNLLPQCRIEHADFRLRFHRRKLFPGRMQLLVFKLTAWIDLRTQRSAAQEKRCDTVR